MSGLDPSSAEDIRAAFEAGTLRLEVDPVRKLATASGRTTFLGDDGVPADTELRVLHVISRAAGGEIRGYVRIEATGELRLRGPQPGAWEALDAVVEEMLAAQGMEVARKRIAFLDRGPDRQGRRHFAVSWHDGERCRGQVFHAAPPEGLFEVGIDDATPCVACFRGRGRCELRRTRCP